MEKGAFDSSPCFHLNGFKKKLTLPIKSLLHKDAFNTCLVITKNNVTGNGFLLKVSAALLAVQFWEIALLEFFCHFSSETASHFT